MSEEQIETEPGKSSDEWIIVRSLRKQGRMVHKDKLGSFSLIVPAGVQQKEADHAPLPIMNDPGIRKLDAEHADLSKALLKRIDVRSSRVPLKPVNRKMLFRLYIAYTILLSLTIHEWAL